MKNQTVFPDEPSLSPLPDGKNWRLDQPFYSDIPCLGPHRVPYGFKTDLASTPRLIWWLYPPFGKYIEAAIVHDHLYATQRLPRWLCDRALRQGMLACGCGKVTICIFWAGVRMAGWLSWLNDQKIYGLR